VVAARCVAARPAARWATESWWTTVAGTSARAPAATETTRARPAETAARRAWRTTGPAILTRARFADRERAPHEELSVELADGLFGRGALSELDKGEPPRSPGLAIERANDLGGFPELREVGTQIFFGCLIGQVTDKQSDWWHG
jgi:hypothetical protein